MNRATFSEWTDSINDVARLSRRQTDTLAPTNAGNALWAATILKLAGWFRA